MWKRRSPLDRRIKKLESEQQLIDGNMRALSKVLRRHDGAAPAGPPSANRRSKAEGVDANPAAPGPHGPVPEPPRVEAPGKESAVQAGSTGLGRDQRFASYLSAGSLMNSRPLRQEKSVQRNKAVFMVLVVLLLAFIVFQLVF